MLVDAIAMYIILFSTIIYLIWAINKIAKDERNEK
jgi:hypothetical protein